MFQSDVLRKDDIYIEDDLEGSGGGNREFNKDDLEASGSGYGPDDEDGPGSGDDRECICCLFYYFYFVLVIRYIQFVLLICLLVVSLFFFLFISFPFLQFFFLPRTIISIFEPRKKNYSTFFVVLIYDKRSGKCY